MKKRNPRHGSMQFWPRVRAKRQHTRIRSWGQSKDAVPLCFAGYKAGMTQVFFTDNKKVSPTKGQEISSPVTIVECPPMKVIGARAYKKGLYNTKVVAQTLSPSKDVKIPTPKNQKIPTIEKAEDASYINLIVHTQPKLTGIGKKKPEVFEIGLGGSVADQINLAKEKIGQEIAVSDVFKVGQIVDSHVVTKGYGTQGPVKRFGINLKKKKSEKATRTPGSISGGWTSQMHMMYRVAFAGQTGYHTRTEYNKQIMAIEEDVAKVNPNGGLVRFGNVKNTYLLVKGSLGGPKKRLIKLTKAVRSKVEAVDAPAIDHISIESNQG